MVGASDCARIAAVDAYSVKAWALPVEKVAVPPSSFADGVPSLSSIVALLALNSSNLGYYDNNGTFVVNPGAFDVFVSDSSQGGLQSQFTLG